MIHTWLGDANDRKNNQVMCYLKDVCQNTSYNSPFLLDELQVISGITVINDQYVVLSSGIRFFIRNDPALLHKFPVWLQVLHKYCHY